MQSNQDLKLITSELESLYAQMKMDSLDLESATELTTQAVSVYQRFTKAYGQETMDVKVVQTKNLKEGVIFIPFAWKNL